MKSRIARLTFLVLAFLTLPLAAANESLKPYFLNATSWDFLKIIPLPANKTPEEEKKDLNLLKDAMAARTKKQVFRALIASSDSVFDYDSVIGPQFNAKELPYAAAVFKKIENDTNIAIYEAKEAFRRRRPKTWVETKKNESKSSHYAYPSGHSTRAFLWGSLLTDLFPEKAKDIDIEARTKAWNRVILGRHYPDDVYGGELYGKYLAKQFLQDPHFQKEWALVKKEIKKNHPSHFSSKNDV